MSYWYPYCQNTFHVGKVNQLQQEIGTCPRVLSTLDLWGYRRSGLKSLLQVGYGWDLKRSPTAQVNTLTMKLFSLWFLFFIERAELDLGKGLWLTILTREVLLTTLRAEA